MTGLAAGDFDRRITFQRKVVDPSFTSAGQEEWEPFAVNVPAQVRDVLPSRGEATSDGLTVANRPARIRIRYRTDITADMRILYGSRIMEIKAGPAELGRRDGLELMAEDYSTSGATT